MANGTSVLERVTSLTILACVLVVTGLYVQSQILPPLNDAAPLYSGDVEYFDDWEVAAQQGTHLAGPEYAPVTIIEFMDFQCAFCKRLVPVVDSIRSLYPSDINVIVHHFPLDRHAMSTSAAIAAECAGSQGAFRPMFDILFANQEALPTVSWRDLAGDAGVPDLEHFEACLSDQEVLTRVDYGRTLGEQVGLRGTPTLLVNGIVVPGVPSVARLRSLVEQALTESG